MSGEIQRSGDRSVDRAARVALVQSGDGHAARGHQNCRNPERAGVRRTPSRAWCRRSLGCAQRRADRERWCASLPQLGVDLTDMRCTVSGAGALAGGDSLSISDCRATTPAAQRGAERGAIAVNGWAKNVARFLLTKPDPAKPPPPPSFRFAVGLRNFHAYNKRSVADVYVTDACDRPVAASTRSRLVGDLNAARLTGAVQVDRSAIFLADRDLARKLRPARSSSGTSGGETVVGGRAGLSTLMANLRSPTSRSRSATTSGSSRRKPTCGWRDR